MYFVGKCKNDHNVATCNEVVALRIKNLIGGFYHNVEKRPNIEIDNYMFDTIVCVWEREREQRKTQNGLGQWLFSI